MNTHLQKKTPKYQTPLKDSLCFVLYPCLAIALLTFKQCFKTSRPPSTLRAHNNKALADSGYKFHEFK